MGGLKTTRWLYPSQWRFDLMQLLQMGLSSPHLMRRFRHVRHPVLVLLRAFVLVSVEDLALGSTSFDEGSEE